ncbi:EF-P lysine aminoacylase EpmA [Candidatus Laterigemmans baculatus]|uniref:EF-P lysine aminoacylase EpmA n=1 Tax=Candidatus Laterigemmans baculatus TaxID=2770505 RepID=UPI0013DD3049|nr:EF-P lysine aminoacylase EpmA [Candidatus Laterigemmans baculatus]
MSAMPMSEHSLSPNWQPTARIENLRRRALILRRIREFFDSAGFFEVQTPCLSNETVVDQHLDPVLVHRDALRGGRYSDPNHWGAESLGSDESAANAPWMYLQTSPEAAMKRLLAAGAGAIYQMGPVFRSDERGALHNPEFTMLEWYRTGDSMEAGIERLRNLVQHILGGPLPQVVTYLEVFQQAMGIDPYEISDAGLRDQLAKIETGYVPSGDESRDTCLDLLMGLVVAPSLSGRTIVSNYPLTQAALARRSEVDPRTAERFELFIDGVELANGYAELLDAEVLGERTRQSNQLRSADGRRPLPAPERLFAAMRHGLPPCSGTAMGVDRLVMAALAAERIDEVIPFPVDRA